MKSHVVRDGDCFTSIAHENGFFWETLWNHPENAALRERRRDPFTLAPGDVVIVPDKRLCEYVRPTGKYHQFKRRGVPAKLRVRLIGPDGAPRAGAPCEIEIDGKRLPDTKADGDGWVEEAISPGARVASLAVRGGEERYTLLLGHLRPIDEVAGVQMRLSNLGLYDGPIDGAPTQATLAAVQIFQLEHDLEPTGELDDATRAAVKDAFGG